MSWEPGTVESFMALCEWPKVRLLTTSTRFFCDFHQVVFGKKSQIAKITKLNTYIIRDVKFRFIAGQIVHYGFILICYRDVKSCLIFALQKNDG